MGSRRGALLGTAILYPLFFTAWSAQAQEAPGASADSGDIVVTARRREESLQDVPVAVVAFGAAQIEERQLRTEADLQRTVPGLTIRETEGSNQIAFSIRGQTIDAFTGSALAVVPYINEVQANGNAASNFYDLGSIQVLKGPQGTLFGRNATGGAVLFATAKPTNEFTGEVTASYGNYDYWELKGALNVPIVDGKVLLRVAGDIIKRDGYQRNIFNGGNNLNPRLGKTDRQSGRASLTLEPVEGLSNTTVFEYTRTRGNSTSVVPWSVNLPGSVDATTGLPLATSSAFLYSPALDIAFQTPGAWDAYLAAHPGANPAGYAEVVRRQREELGAYTVDVTDQHGKMFFRGRNHYLTNTTTFDLSDDVLVKNIFGWTKSRSHYNISEQGAPYFVQCTCNVATNDFGNFEKTRAISDELQLQGKALDGGLDYIIGAYYYKGKSLTHWPQTYFDLTPLLPPSTTTSSFNTRNESKALFFQLNYDLGKMGIEGLSLTGGFRYTWEKVSLDQLADGNSFNVFPTNSLTTKFDKPSWTVGMDYKPNEDLLLYVVHRGSWRSGGINGVAPLLPSGASGGGALFEPETAKDVEVGLKWGGRVMDRPARFNIAVFKQWIKNIQRAEFPIVDRDGPGGADPTSIAVTVNVPEAQVKGFEVDTSIRPSDWLEIGGNLSYTDAKYTDNQAIVFGNLFVFNPYADTPKWAGTLYGQVTLPLDPSTGKLRLRADIYAQTGQYFSNNDGSITPGTRLPGYSLINARLDWSEIMGSNFSAAAFVRNLTNKSYFVGGLSQGASLGENAAAPGRPRMYGIEATVKF